MIRPMHDYVLVEPIHASKTKGGLVLPETAQSDFEFQGRVLAIGPGKRGRDGLRIPMEGVKVGDIVTFAKRMGWELEYEGQRMLAIHEADLIAVQDDVIESEDVEGELHRADAR